MIHQRSYLVVTSHHRSLTNHHSHVTPPLLQHPAWTSCCCLCSDSLFPIIVGSNEVRDRNGRLVSRICDGLESIGQSISELSKATAMASLESCHLLSCIQPSLVCVLCVHVCGGVWSGAWGPNYHCLYWWGDQAAKGPPPLHCQL